MDDLFIPIKILKNSTISKGFGAVELRRTIILAIVGGLIGICYSIINDLTAIQVLTYALIASGFFGSIGYLTFKRNTENLSVYMLFILAKRFWTSQRYYMYKKMKEW